MFEGAHTRGVWLPPDNSKVTYIAPKLPDQVSEKLDPTDNMFHVAGYSHEAEARIDVSCLSHF